MIFPPSLSIVINILIILIFKFLKREIKVLSDSQSARFISIAIIFLVGLISSANFIYLVWVSFDNNSNIIFAEKLTVRLAKTDEINAADLETESPDSNIAKNINNFDVMLSENDYLNRQCLKRHTPFMPIKTASIYDLLHYYGLDTSFSYRARLASNLGITEYSGTSMQNLQIIKILKKKDNLLKLICDLPLASI